MDSGLPLLLADAIAAAAAGRSGLLVAALTGPQGSGKSTAAADLPDRLAAHGLRAAVLALDDLYLPKAARARLAAQVHPLLATRGVPGTHDVALGVEVLDGLGRSGRLLVPRFDKAVDDRLAREDWRSLHGPFDVVVFEGWCVGARPQAAAALARPINDLERERDAKGVWRRFVNDALGGPYRALFAPIGWQGLLAAPSFETVLGWRLEQEKSLRAERGAAAGQSDAEIADFVQHYERLTRHIAAEMPARADLTVRLGAGRELLHVDQAG